MVAEIDIYKRAESGELAEEYKSLKEAFVYTLKETKLAASALSYLKNEGWYTVTIEGTVKIKEYEDDVLGTEYLIVNNAGFRR